MELYVAPAQIYHRPLGLSRDRPKALFLAGGITGTPDWQSRAVLGLQNTEFVVLNPRREGWPAASDTDEIRRQIAWERHHIDQADGVLFWFCEETVQPIVLFELGTLVRSTTTLLIGVHPNYPRKLDVEMQVKLMRPDFGDVADTLNEMIDHLCAWDARIKLQREEGWH